jgi:hypothetical protein
MKLFAFATMTDSPTAPGRCGRGRLRGRSIEHPWPLRWLKEYVEDKAVDGRPEAPEKEGKITGAVPNERRC